MINQTSPGGRFYLITLLLSILSLWTITARETAAADKVYLRVASTGNDLPACGSDSAPCRSIQYALNKAETGHVITVASGTYTYNPSADNCSFLTTRAVACFVDKDLTILGGYPADNWQRADPSQNPTIIDGQNTRRGVAVIAFNTTASLHMEGFTIQNGLAQGAGGGDDFLTSAFGGGMWAQGGSVVLKQITFKNNRALGGNTNQAYGGGGAGGGLAIQSSKNGIPSQLENVLFEGNQAIGGTGAQRGGVAIGGGIFTFASILSGTDLTFTNNQARAGSSPGSGYAGGLRADALGGAAGFQINSQSILSRISVSGNQAVGGNAGPSAEAVGGGGFGGGLSAEKSALTLTSAVIMDNAAQGGQAASGGLAYGGGFLIDTSEALIDKIKVLRNTSRSGGSTTGGSAGSPFGGGGYLTGWGSSTPPGVKISNSIFSENWIQVGTPGKPRDGYAGGLGVQGLTAEVTHATFARNYFVGDFIYGQAIAVFGMYGTSGTPGILNLASSIVSDHVHPSTNFSAITVLQGSSLNLYGGLFAGNTNDTNSNGAPILPGLITGLSSVIQAASARYVSPGPPDYNYHLQPTSPAVDRGSSQYLSFSIGDDIDGQSRPYGTAADLGADEYMPPALTATPAMLTVFTDQDEEISRSVVVGTSDGSALTWEATTTAAWLYLGPSGTSRTTTGQTGEILVVRYAPGTVALGDYAGLVSITSPSADPASFNTRLLKLDRLYQAHLPLIIR